MQYNDDNENLNEAEKSVNEDLEGFNTASDERDNPYPTKVDFNKEQYSFFEIKRKIEEYNEIILDPDFQRNPKIWDEKRKTRLIESIIMGIPLPLFYFAETNKGILSVVDGLQRLNTVISFMNDEFSLKKLTYLNEYNTLKFSKLPRNIQSAIERYQIQANVIDSKTPEKIKLDIFERINSGGLALNRQEIRNAIYQGKSTKLLNDLVSLQSFQDAIDKQINSKRMRDKYVVLRFLAFYLLENKEKFKIEKFDLKADFDAFLADTMQILNTLPDEKIDYISLTFSIVIEKAYKLYGRDAFKRDNISTNPFNMIIFESTLFLLSFDEVLLHDDIFLKMYINLAFSDSVVKNNIENSLKGKAAMQLHFEKLKQAYMWRNI